MSAMLSENFLEKLFGLQDNRVATLEAENARLRSLAGEALHALEMVEHISPSFNFLERLRAAAGEGGR